MECHLVVATEKTHPPLCTRPWLTRGRGLFPPCGHPTEHAARKVRAHLAEVGVYVMVRRGPCPEAETFDRQQAEREKRASR